MNVKDSLKNYCRYCKNILTNPKEIELHYHFSCNENFLLKETNKHKEVVKLLAKSLDVTENQITKHLLHNDINYVLDKDQNIIELKIIPAHYNLWERVDVNLINHIDIPTAEFQELKILSVSYDYDWNYQDGWLKSGFKDVQKNIGELKKLEILNFSGNSIRTLPDSIGDLTNLRELYLQGNPIQLLPETITNLKDLEILDLSDTLLITKSFTTLPSSVQIYLNGLMTRGSQIIRNKSIF